MHSMPREEAKKRRRISFSARGYVSRYGCEGGRMHSLRWKSKGPEAKYFQVFPSSINAEDNSSRRVDAGGGGKHNCPRRVPYLSAI
jgi:hypothetical protein